LEVTTRRPSNTKTTEALDRRGSPRPLCLPIFFRTRVADKVGMVPLR
jgi:hypothetical protein